MIQRLAWMPPQSDFTVTRNTQENYCHDRPNNVDRMNTKERTHTPKIAYPALNSQTERSLMIPVDNFPHNHSHATHLIQPDFIAQLHEL
eukprot:scaffold746_cov293-Chaetoceros_neogracile.AAC.10